MRASAPGPIVITLPDGSTVQGEAGSTSPMAVANGISKQLASSSVVALVDGELWDMSRPLERSCALEVLPFDDARAQQVFWHSSAHILGQALELQRGALLVTGPATEEGFFYDVHVAAAAPAPHHAVAARSGGPQLFDLREGMLPNLRRSLYTYGELTSVSAPSMAVPGAPEPRAGRERARVPT